MKIVSGKFGGRKLFTPQNRDIRPTSDKIRGAVFNMLGSREALKDANVLDAFCGTGALGLEALSRGAAHCTFTDKMHASLNLAKENAQMLKVMDICDFILADASKIGSRSDIEEPYDLVFLDPPYNQILVCSTLQALVDGDWIAIDGLVICETEKYYDYVAMDGFILDNEKIYGDTKVILLKYSR